ncbi:phosphodiester glycosidase family protein [Paenibacillus thermoaerophilus]|uniref:Phosphodiester glycosidase family protein n=1 Tax=Paenibacillus thermoaerophilus TaxID=1215385 RepID=A0ABW2V765_9BACL|nr:phosphodiester glycosidase family protein [Paenibacillus thermoaerophilus]TMV17925.1 phosphodiester glycosidase family protein [Paenibacillus thermoaerophilus]
MNQSGYRVRPAAETPPLPPRSAGRRAGRQARGRPLRWFGRLAAAAALAGALAVLFLFATPWGSSLRYTMADTLITTQHRHWAAWLIGEQGLKERVAQYNRQFESYAELEDETVVAVAEPQPAPGQETLPLTELIEVEGDGFKGHLMIVRDPLKVRLGVPAKPGMGEKVSEMVKRTGAVAGINAGGFVDPEGMGNGFKPIGLVISGGEIWYRDVGMETPTHVVGIDKTGRMIAGKYKPNELIEMGVKEAVSFSPRIILNGQGLFKSDKEGWGLAPRTAIGQRADGALLFLVIDGRQKHSVGATLYDVQEVLLEHGAVIAANLDGGSSTVLATSGGHVVNKPASPYGERLLPTAFLVFEQPDGAPVRNVWEGLNREQIDPSKWIK